jgi:hypothetical protein
MLRASSTHCVAKYAIQPIIIAYYLPTDYFCCHPLYCSPSIIRMIKPRRMRWAGHVARMEAKRNAYRIFLGKPDGKRPLGRLRRRWDDNIRMDLRE